MTLWLELTIEFGFTALSGVLTYQLCRTIYGMPEGAASVSAATAVILVIFGIYCGHCLRRINLLALPANERAPVAPVAWRSVRHGLRAGLLGLVATFSGYAALHLFRIGSLTIAMFVSAGSLVASVFALVAASNAWREIRR